MTISHSIPMTLVPPDEGLPIVRIGPERLEEAAANLVSPPGKPSVQSARRFLDYARENRICLDELWAMLDRRGRVGSVVLAVPHPGRTAMLFANRVDATSACIQTARVVDRVCEVLTARDVRVAQALLEPREKGERATFRQAGFEVLASLSYLERSTRRALPFEAPLPPDVSAISYQPENQQEFLEALHASYEETLDCPGLTGLRSTEDIFEGHRATGAFDPALWTLLRLDGRPAGVLMLNPSPAHGSIELVYVGLAKWARGRGLGRCLLARAFESVRERNERSMTLAVDERNAPAIRLYYRAGFRRLLRRAALIRSLKTPR